MVTFKKPYHTLLNYILLNAVGCAVMLTPTTVVLPPYHWQQADSIISAPAASIALSETAPSPALTSVSPSPAAIEPPSDTTHLPQQGILPTILTQRDIKLYKAIFTAQKQADWLNADTAIAHLKNKLLLGHVLAERYLDRHYNATVEELSAWLNRYSDHPQAAAIYARVTARMPSLKAELPLVRKQPSLEGYGDDNGLGRPFMNEDSPAACGWRLGLHAWKSGKKDRAALFFANVTEHQEEISPWMLSAAAYWAYRSYNAIGNHLQADQFLRLAATQPRSFYGILARKQLKQKLGLDTSPVVLTDNDVLQMVGDQSIRRTVALTQAGFHELAEKELRQRFPDADDNEKQRLLALAHELGLASVQMSMARQLGSDGHELDFARYPIPNLQPDGGFKVDPLLIFALMRQESGFRASAVSSGGALGLMQLMPKTASLMHQQMNANEGKSGVPELSASSVAEPTINITLGQNYVEHLLTNNLVEGNLVYLLTAYNAGPGRLQEWKSSIAYNNDPLLFIESIPIAQTHNYVMQVLTNYWIYTELDGSVNNSIYSLLHGRWPAYSEYQGPLADKSAAQAGAGGV